MGPRCEIQLRDHMEDILSMDPLGHTIDRWPDFSKSSLCLR